MLYHTLTTLCIPEKECIEIPMIKYLCGRRRHAWLVDFYAVSSGIYYIPEIIEFPEKFNYFWNIYFWGQQQLQLYFFYFYNKMRSIFTCKIADISVYLCIHKYQSLQSCTTMCIQLLFTFDVCKIPHFKNSDSVW